MHKLTSRPSQELPTHIQTNCRWYWPIDKPKKKKKIESAPWVFGSGCVRLRLRTRFPRRRENHPPPFREVRCSVRVWNHRRRKRGGDGIRRRGGSGGRAGRRRRGSSPESSTVEATDESIRHRPESARPCIGGGDWRGRNSVGSWNLRWRRKEAI